MRYELNLEAEALSDYSKLDKFEEQAADSFWELDEFSDHECESCSEFENVSAKDVLRRAGLKTTTWADKRTPMLIQTVLEQSLVLRPFIATKLGKISIPKNLVHYGSDAEFNHTYLKLNKIVVPFGSKEEKGLINIRGFYHRSTDSIYLRPLANVGLVLRLGIHKFSSLAFFSFFGKSMTEGLGLYFTNRVLQEQGLEQLKPENQKDQLDCAIDLVGLVGLDMVGKAYFQNFSDLVNHLTTKLSIGSVRTEELAKYDLCKTSLLRTARFASQQMKNMVAVGSTGPRSVRLWMRTQVPGMHELQILGGSGETRSAKIMIPAGQRGDKTTAVKYPQSTEQLPLNPLTKYRYRIVRTSDGMPLGKGSFETSPASDGDTPQKVVIAVISCHQPFKNRGTIAPESDRMLRLLPRILQENNVKFVLPCGDQIYSDYPEDMSLFKNPYLIRQVVPAKTNIYKCSEDEVRRLYDMRYRMFWSLKPIQKMYANYPCYPAMDDHEIEDDWGSMKEHSSPRYRNILNGARQAYFDYQASRVMPPMTQLPKSFHYNFSYGNIGVFVMDIRSERFANSPNNQLYSKAQLIDLSQFLRANSQKKVLLIVSSVPVVHLPSWLTNLGHKIKGPDVDFLDQWSFEKNNQSRNAFLSLLHKHQQANPKQRVAIVSGDVHIGCAFDINWQGGNNPHLYQFTSSAISNLFQGWEADFSAVGPQLVSSISCPDTPFGGRCAGRVGLLPAVTGAGSRNPLTKLNLGLIEIQRNGDVSKLKFKLIGYHPNQERPITYFESRWLG